MFPIIIYKTVFKPGQITATDTDPDAFYDPDNIGDYFTWSHWLAGGVGTKYLTANAGAPTDADTLLVVDSNLKTVGASVSVESSTDNFASVITERLTPFAPSKDGIFARTFPLASAPYWRLKITGATAAPGMAVVLLGKRITFLDPPDGPYIHHNFGVQSNEIVAEYGDPLGELTDYEDFDFSLKVSKIDRTFVLDNILTFWDEHYKLGLPFGFAWDLDVFPGDVYFGKRPRGFRYKMPLKDYSLAESINIRLKGRKF